MEPLLLFPDPAPPELAQAFGIASIPTLLVIRDGRTVNRAVGVRSKEEILQMLD